jgi:hypothetical protein
VKQKRKIKTGHRLSNKRLLIVAIGLLVVLMLALANMAYMTSYRTSVAEQTATSVVLTNEHIPYSMSEGAETATQVKIDMEATVTGEAP